MKTNIRFWAFRTLVVFLLLADAGISFSQEIVYSEPEREDSRRTNFEIIGKVGPNILIYKNNRNDNDICVYDFNMKLLERVPQTENNDRWINVDFVPYPDFTWMIYQFQRKNILYCKAVKIGPDGKRLTEPVELDTTRIGWAADNKIYTTVFSDDKQKIMVFKINNKNPKSFLFTTMLFDAGLNLQERNEMSMPMQERNDYFTDFLLDNEGDMVFGKFLRRNGSDYVSNVSLIIKKKGEPYFRVKDIEMEEHVLDEIKLKVDNTNRRYLFNSFFYKQKRGTIEGLYVAIFDKGLDSLVISREMVFGDDLRSKARGQDASLRMAFDSYFITDVITKRNGGFVLVAESMYNDVRGGNTWNRWNNMYYNNPWGSPLDYYYWSPYSYYGPWGSPYYRWDDRQNTRFHADNIMLLSLDSTANVDWTNVISKAQYAEETDALVSHLTMITGGELHFLYNANDRRTILLSDQSVSPDGQITRYPTLRNLDRDINFLTRYGKQISATAAVMPCFNRNYLTFALIQY